MIFVFFPIFAAICYALAYIFDEIVLEKINVATLMLTTTIFGFPLSLLAVYALTRLKDQNIQLDAYQDKSFLLLVLLAFSLALIGFLFTLFALQKTSASYAAFAEISYPLFTVVFLFLFFGMREFNPSMLIGGGLVFIGSCILVYGQLKVQS